MSGGLPQSYFFLRIEATGGKCLKSSSLKNQQKKQGNFELELRGISVSSQMHKIPLRFRYSFKRNFACITGAISEIQDKGEPKQENGISGVLQIAATHTSYRDKDSRSQARQHSFMLPLQP